MAELRTDSEEMKLVERLRAGIRYLPRAATEDSEEYRAFRAAGDSIAVNEGDLWLALVTMQQAADTIARLVAERDEAVTSASALEGISHQLDDELSACKEEVERLRALLTKCAKAARSLELAETELQRAEAAFEQPRLQKAGNRHYFAVRKLYRAASEARAALQSEGAKQ